MRKFMQYRFDSPCGVTCLLQISEADRIFGYCVRDNCIELSCVNIGLVNVKRKISNVELESLFDLQRTWKIHCHCGKQIEIPKLCRRVCATFRNMKKELSFARSDLISCRQSLKPNFENAAILKIENGKVIEAVDESPDRNEE